jgi:hypothetical protein
VSTLSRYPLLYGVAVAVLAVGAARDPLLSLGAGLAVFAASLAVYLRARLPEIYLVCLGLCLTGYALLGRGFAYIGIPPLYIGEATLLFGLLALALCGGLGAILRSPLVWLLGVFMLSGAAATVPHIGVHGLDALRDAVQWGYGLFALVVASLLLKSQTVVSVVHVYARWLPWYLLGGLGFYVVGRVLRAVALYLPGTDVPIFDLKGGDFAVHLAGALAFLVLGIYRSFARSRTHHWAREWGWWLLWLMGVATVANGRAPLLTIGAVSLLLLFLRPWGHWVRLSLIVFVLGSAFVVSGVEFRPSGSERVISAEGILTTIQGIGGSTGESAYDGSRRWRLMWWGDIIQYTVFGEHFWTGKGYGVNLADADGYQVGDGTLRSPHNGHLTILARSGVPGALTWLVLQFAFAFSLLSAYVRSLRRREGMWAKVNLWLLAYWLAFMINATFDVYLEGPQGGIWFWSVFGFGIAALEAQRRGVNWVSYAPRNRASPLGS